MMLAVLASFAQEESRSMSENNKWSIRKKFERGEVMITTSRFLGYDKNEYGYLIVNRKEAEIVSLTFDLYLMNVGSSRIGKLLDYPGVKTLTGTTWESGTINGMLCNEKYKGDFHLQKYYIPENKRNHTRKTTGKYRVITFRKITNQLYRRRYGKRCRKSGNRESVTGISDRTAQ